ncbi:hypothetical protein EDD16DRAFT_1725904 [Pisolithus croceorrhizus]|nr:hypothetical protein EDD16DRAFT_1725904 [Pisolithus croceorrhizus]
MTRLIFGGTSRQLPVIPLLLLLGQWAKCQTWGLRLVNDGSGNVRILRDQSRSCQDGLVSGRRLPTSRHIPSSEIDDHKASIAICDHNPYKAIEWHALESATG